ncbi:putative ABC transport system ATP-binding protein [Amycolatopsis lurida]|uniref:ABC transporter n=1 Tax=Amycolatopsis lurida NRRL 2430 TaxID=1460371 RepID=A0A2P2FKM1_AMYLU|nr:MULTISPECIES: ABC transporter ATP-binding protein [Amycolatopsis]KFU77277.1 ABC transporter [Amycolatopsis lurida NRRL 2430]QXV62851.1 ABC transporter ATP-binding protein [Amycolatopsis sp. TNS106]SEB35991.1 putative ABC transport system ATP-binding protein [Amycolatopsis lurida]
MNSGGTRALALESVSKVYGSGDGAVTALNGVTVEVRKGSFTAVMGPSGSGKSTFLHCAAGLDKPSSGRVLLGDTELNRLREKALTELRRTRIGFIFQAYNLLPSLNVLQNITLPMRLAGKKPDPQWLREIVEGVGIAKRLEHRPSELSGGQQQRVAIARALITRPEVVLADEPTGALDTRTARQVLDLLRSIVDSMGQTVLMVTHDPVAASAAHGVLFLADGKLAGHLPQPTPERVAERMTHLGEW